MKAFNDFIRRIGELEEKPPKSSQTDKYLAYTHKLDELTYIWKDELLECLPRFTKEELREFIEREVSGGKARKDVLM